MKLFNKALHVALVLSLVISCVTYMPNRMFAGNENEKMSDLPLSVEQEDTIDSSENEDNLSDSEQDKLNTPEEDEKQGTQQSESTPEGFEPLVFPDYEYLSLLLERGIVQGDQSGDLALDHTITRAEWLTILHRVVKDRGIRLLKPSITPSAANQLEGHWAKDDVQFWISYGIVKGDATGNLRLGEQITIAEMLVLLDRMTQWEPYKYNVNEALQLHQNHWSYPSLQRLYQKGWLQFEEPIWEHSLELDRPALRGEGLLMLAPLFHDIETEHTPLTLTMIDDIWDQPIDINGDGRLDFSFRLPDTSYSLQKIAVTKETYAFLKQKEWKYEVFQAKNKIGELRFQLQLINEKDVAYFIRYQPIVETNDLQDLHVDSKHFQVELIYYNKDELTGRIPVSEIGEEKLPYEWQMFTVDDTLTLPQASVFLTGEQVEMRVSATDTFSELGYSVRDYRPDDQTESIVIKEENNYRFTYSFTNERSKISETWGILAEKGLFDWDRLTFRNFMLRDDISINKKFSFEGLFYRTPHNYVPRSAYSFYLNPANIMGVRAVSLLQKDKHKGRFLDDFIIMLAHKSVEQQNEQGYWPTHPKSEWLEHDYQIGYNYYDNRRNADNAEFLLAVYEQYPDARIQKSLEDHVKYLIEAIEQHSVQTSESGLLFTDYIGDTKSKISHVALNHHLAVINFLFHWYLETGDETAKSYGLRMIRGIEDTVKLWIKEDKDLYYALYDDFTPHHYPDYLDLTLNDLMKTQYYVAQIVGTSNDSLQALIESKREWIAKIKEAAQDTEKQAEEDANKKDEQEVDNDLQDENEDGNTTDEDNEQNTTNHQDVDKQ